MTVIFFARRFYPLIGGVEKHVLEVGKRLVKKRFRVIVITENYNISQSKNYQLASSTDNIEGIEIIRIDAGREGRLKKFKIWINLLKHFKVIFSADVIHCHDIFFWYLPFRFIFLNKPVYTTFHGYEGNFLPTQKAIVMHKIAEKLSIGNICIGDYIAKWYGTKPTVVTYGAIDLFKNLSNKQIKAVKNVVYVGRLEEEAGILVYLKALNILKLNGLSLNLTVLGDGKQRDNAEKYVIRNKLDVDFKGFVENVNKYIGESNLVFVSRYLGIMEAMAMKRPVFAEYNNAIKKDYLNMAPFADFISVCRDERELSKNLESFIKGKSKLNTDKAYGWVKDKTWDMMVNQYLRLWRIN